MEVDLFGWDLIYRSVENDLVRKEDLLIAFTHWFLIKNGFSCIGNGNSKSLTGEEVKSEVLSPGWNQQEDYNIRYVQDDRLYLLRASVTGGDMIYNFLRADDLCISSCIFKVDETVKEIKGNISTTMPSFKNVLGTLKRDLIEPVFVKSTTSVAGTQTATPAPDQRQNPFPSPLIEPQRDPWRVPRIGQDDVPFLSRWEPPAIGRGDLDPFGRGGGGGMIFDPRRNLRDPLGPGPSLPTGLPRGAVPPGARFDPFAPPGTGRAGRSDPDPDHLPPPGYDDMFM